MADKINARAYLPDVIDHVPINTDDETKGFEAGAIVQYEIPTGNIYVCLRATANTAIWLRMPNEKSGVVGGTGDALEIDFGSHNHFRGDTSRAVAGATSSLNIQNGGNAEVYVMVVEFAVDCQLTFSQGIKHEFDTDNTKDIYKVASNILAFKAGEYTIGGNKVSGYWNVLAKKIAI